VSGSPLVSIIIPTYNQSEYLNQALISVLEQTFSRWEAIVINNFSNDDTQAVVESFNDPRITLINFRNHGIIAASRNRGIEIAKGKYLAFLDSDDYWFPEKLETCLDVLEPEGEFVCHGLHLFGCGYNKDRFYGPEKKFEFNQLLNQGNCVATSAVVTRADLVRKVGGISEAREMVTAEDYHLWLKMAKIGTKAKFIDNILGAYRYHSDNTGSIARQAQAVKSVISDFYPKVQSRTITDKIKLRLRFGIIEYGVGRIMQSNDRFESAWAFFWRALKLNPFHYKTYIAIMLNLFKINPDK